MSFSVFQEAILGQNYCEEDNHNDVSITFSSSFAPPDTYVCFSILSIFKNFWNTLSFQLSVDQSKYTHTQQGILGSYLKKIDQERLFRFKDRFREGQRDGSVQGT